MSEARLLLVSYNFPPHQTAGALRWQKFAHALAERGVHLDVLIGAGKGPSGAIAVPDGVPPGTRVFALDEQWSRLAGLEDAAVAAVRRLLPGTRRSEPDQRATDTGARGPAPTPAPASLPPDTLSWVPRSVRDARRAYWVMGQYEKEHRWARTAVRTGRTLLRDNTYRGVIASGPTHGAYLAGQRLAAIGSLPLVLDFRDPWSLVRRVPEGYAHPLYFALARHFERSVVGDAKAVILNTPAVLEAMRRRYPEHPNMVCIPNGFDEVFEAPPSRDEFNIVYAGAIYLDRDPRPLFAALALLEADPTVDLTGVHLDLFGKVDSYDGVPTDRLVAEAGVTGRVRLHAPVPREELYERLRDASVLVNLPQDSPWAVPSKVYEYLGFPAWLLAFASPGSPVARLLEPTRADIIRPGDVEATAAVLKRRLAQFRAGEHPERPVENEDLSRAAQSAKLMKLLSSIGLLEGGEQNRLGAGPTNPTGEGR